MTLTTLIFLKFWIHILAQIIFSNHQHLKIIFFLILIYLNQ